MPVKPNALDADDDVFLRPDDELPNRSKRGDRKPEARFQRTPNPYSRVTLQWLTHPVPAAACIFSAEARLFLYLQYHSREGQRGVVMTDKFAAEVRVGPSQKRKIIRSWVKRRLVRVERSTPLSAPIVWPVLPRG